jgi:signal recognition particle receptor subunit beta
MPIHNASAREIVYKIAYHGPGMCGKTTNLRFMYNTLPGRQVGRFLVLDTAVERTLYYDFLPIVVSLEDGYKARIHLYTVPGQAYYDASRRLVLRGVDGVVFVADSHPDRSQDNIDSLAMLKKDLGESGLDHSTIPLIMQWNKRDLPRAIPEKELADALNERAVPAFSAVARDGAGVFETLSGIVDAVTGKT